MHLELRQEREFRSQVGHCKANTSTATTLPAQSPKVDITSIVEDKERDVYKNFCVHSVTDFPRAERVNTHALTTFTSFQVSAECDFGMIFGGVEHFRAQTRKICRK